MRRLVCAAALLIVVATAPACSRRGSPATLPDPTGGEGPASAAPAAQPRERSETDARTTPPAQRQAPPDSPPVDNGTAAALRGRIALARELVAVLAGRELSAAQRLNADTATAFLAQAERALTEGDPPRAELLAEKGTILLEDVERATRPR